MHPSAPSYAQTRSKCHKTSSDSSIEGRSSDGTNQSSGSDVVVEDAGIQGRFTRPAVISRNLFCLLLEIGPLFANLLALIIKFVARFPAMNAPIVERIPQPAAQRATCNGAYAQLQQQQRNMHAPKPCPRVRHAQSSGMGAEFRQLLENGNRLNEMVINILDKNKDKDKETSFEAEQQLEAATRLLPAHTESAYSGDAASQMLLSDRKTLHKYQYVMQAKVNEVNSARRKLSRIPIYGNHPQSGDTDCTSTPTSINEIGMPREVASTSKNTTPTSRKSDYSKKSTASIYSGNSRRGSGDTEGFASRSTNSSAKKALDTAATTMIDAIREQDDDGLGAATSAMNKRLAAGKCPTEDNTPANTVGANKLEERATSAKISALNQEPEPEAEEEQQASISPNYFDEKLEEMQRLSRASSDIHHASLRKLEQQMETIDTIQDKLDQAWKVTEPNLLEINQCYSFDAQLETKMLKSFTHSAEHQGQRQQSAKRSQRESASEREFEEHNNPSYAAKRCDSVISLNESIKTEIEGNTPAASRIPSSKSTFVDNEADVHDGEFVDDNHSFKLYAEPCTSRMRADGNKITAKTAADSSAPSHNSKDAVPTAKKQPIAKKLQKKTATKPAINPRDELNTFLENISSTNWEVIIKGLTGMLKLMSENTEVFEPQVTLVAQKLAITVRNLRSQVARIACQAAATFFQNLGVYKTIEKDSDELICSLLHRSTDTNHFLRGDAQNALECMCNSLPLSKSISVLCEKGCKHHHALVRTTTAKLFCYLAENNTDRIFKLNKAIRDKFLIALGALLQEGSLETRTQAKNCLRHLKQHNSCDQIMRAVIPTKDYRSLEKIIGSV